MKTNIFIPKICKVGFQKRDDTFSGKLGYVIAFDGKKWRKDYSWENWRQKENEEVQVRYDYDLKEYIYETITGVEPIEFDNIPIEGMVLNKKVGGTKYGWNPRQTYCRIYDPRGFEFEINIPNLLYILENCNCIKGKGLEGKFIYGWDGKDLVLIPEDAPEYKEMVEYSNLQDLNVKKSELIIGGKYLFSDNQIRTFMKESYYHDYSYSKNAWTKKKKLWFYSSEDKYNKYQTRDIKVIKKFIEMDDDYANLMDELEDLPGFREPAERYVKLDEYAIREHIRGYNYYWNDKTCAITGFHLNETAEYIPVKLNITTKGYFSDIVNITILISGKTEQFNSTSDLFKRYNLWQLEMTR